MFELGIGSPVVRRSWKLATDARGPVLTGLFGFPWRDPVVQAKCTAGAKQAPQGWAAPADRWHRSVPSDDCTCGIYATNNPESGVLRRHMLRDSVVVTGFVRLSGHLLVAGPTYRAEQAEIVGPLTLAIPKSRLVRRLAGRVGASQQIRRVVLDGDRWQFRYTAGRRGVSIGEWHRQMNEALSFRYGVDVVGLVGPVPGLG